MIIRVTGLLCILIVTSGCGTNPFDANRPLYYMYSPESDPLHTTSDGNIPDHPYGPKPKRQAPQTSSATAFMNSDGTSPLSLYPFKLQGQNNQSDDLRSSASNVVIPEVNTESRLVVRAQILSKGFIEDVSARGSSQSYSTSQGFSTRCALLNVRLENGMSKWLLATVPNVDLATTSGEDPDHSEMNVPIRPVVGSVCLGYKGYSNAIFQLPKDSRPVQVSITAGYFEQCDEGSNSKPTQCRLKPLPASHLITGTVVIDTSKEADTTPTHPQNDPNSFRPESVSQ